MQAEEIERAYELRVKRNLETLGISLDAKRFRSCLRRCLSFLSFRNPHMEFPTHCLQCNASGIKECDSHRENAGRIGLEEKFRFKCLRILFPITLKIPAERTDTYGDTMQAQCELLTDA